MPRTSPPPRRTRAAPPILVQVSSPPPAITVGYDDGLAPSAQRRSYAQCFAQFIGEARALPSSAVIPYPGDARLALANVRVAVDDLFAQPSRLAGELPRFPLLAALEAPDVARAVVHAADRTAHVPVATPQNVSAALKRVAPRRRAFVQSAQALAAQGLLPREVVAGLGRRRGLAPALEDAATVARLFTVHAARIEGKHPFTRDEVEALARDAQWLQESTLPEGARRPAPRRPGSECADRDRLWTLLVGRHLLLQRLGGYLYGFACELHVPPLRGRAGASLPPEDEDPSSPTR